MHTPQAYNKIDLELIKEDAKKEGFQVSLIEDKPNFTYEPHQHPEAKYLVFLKGAMSVTVGNKTYKCSRGDKLIIPGNTIHSGIVGNKGCTFYWSEKIIK